MAIQPKPGRVRHRSSVRRPVTTRLYQGFKRNISRLKQVLKKLFIPRSWQSSSPEPPSIPLSSRNVNPQSTESSATGFKRPASENVADVSGKRSIGTSRASSRSGVFHFERQQRGMQTCGTHSANMFFGKTALKPIEGRTPGRADDLLRRMHRACDEAGPLDDLPAKHNVFLQEAFYGDELVSALGRLRHDRLILLSGMSSHFVAFRRDASGQWYLLDSAANKPVKISDPGAYLKRIYHGYKPGELDMRGGQVSILAMAGEDLPGFKVT